MSAIITDIKQLDPNKTYTYAEYLTWSLDEYVELIRGKLVRMSPAPSSKHQKISSNLHVAVGSFLRKKTCQIYSAPFDVHLIIDQLETVVQPDISIICDPQKITPQGCKGAPDWIIEILSPSTAQKDLNDKFQIYEKAGVKEYWVVHPNDATILIYLLDENGHYRIKRDRPFSIGEKVQVNILPDLEIELEEVFDLEI